MLPCPRSSTRTALLLLDSTFSQTCVATAHATTSYVFFFGDGSFDDSFMFVTLMVVPGRVDVVLFCLMASASQPRQGITTRGGSCLMRLV